MSITYQMILKKKIDLSPLGWEMQRDSTPYFCTPKGTNILGWAGVDGIHYGTIRGFGDMIFAISPMNFGDYVHPIARNFEDLLRLLLSCVDMAALEQCYAWDEEQFKAFLIDCPAAPEQQAVLNAIQEATGLKPIEDAFGYVKTLQAEFDLSAIPYTDDYYDIDMNPAAPQEPPEWQVYFDGNFWGHNQRQRPGIEIPLNGQFDWADHHWIIPSAYACSKGLVVDLCMRVDPWLIEDFMEKWELTVEDEKRMQMERDDPMSLNFDCILRLNGKEMRSSHGFGVMWNPCLDAQYRGDEEGKRTAEHYGLDLSFGWMIWRSCYPWITKRKPTIKSLSVTMIQQKVAVPGPRFKTEKPGDTVLFIYPENGTEYTLTVQEYEPQVLKTDGLLEQFEYPTHYHMMSYSITPPLPAGTLTIRDCNEGDRPRPKQTDSNEFSPVAFHDIAAIGIIGGADGPTAIIYGNNPSKLHAACSNLHFEPVANVEWRMVFHEKQFEDQIVFESDQFTQKTIEE